MKKFKTGLLALALILGVSGAFVTKIHAAPKAFDATYDWSRVAGSPKSGEVDPLDDATIAQAKDNYGCTGTATVCATGENTVEGQPGASIFLNN